MCQDACLRQTRSLVLEHTVDEGNVKIEKEYHWFQKIEGERPDKDHKCDFFAGHGFAYELRFALQSVIAGKFAQTGGTPIEDIIG